MITRNRYRRLIHATRPFTGQGASLYVSDALPIQYRNLATESFHRQTLRSVQRSVSTRMNVLSGTAGSELEFTPDLSFLAPGTVWLDVRHFRDGIENESEHPQQIVLDESGDPETTIAVMASLVRVEARTGGIIRVYLQCLSDTGLAPESLELVCTAGPTSPATVAVPWSGGGLYQLDTEALSESDTYTFRVDAVTAAVRRQLLTISDVQADASGPPAVSGLIVEVV